MKLRIRGNSLRLRLLRGEVEQFGETGRVAETIRFGDAPAAQLCYILEADDKALEITALFIDRRIVVKVPGETARNWVQSDEISLRGEQPTDNRKQNGVDKNGNSGNILKILIEKDFVCLDRKNDPDNHDAFPHPTGKCA